MQIFPAKVNAYVQIFPSIAVPQHRGIAAYTYAMPLPCSTVVKAIR